MADGRRGIGLAVDGDKSSRHLYSDIFDRDNLIEHLVDEDTVASHGAAAVVAGGVPGGCLLG